MKVLAVETSTMSGSVALLEDDVLISEYLLNIKVTHSERLMPTIDRILRDSAVSFSQIDGLIVSTGPGSFTGLRIGLSTIKGIALAGGKPVVSISTLDVLANNVNFAKYSVCPLLDARKGEIYTALYRLDGKGRPCPVTPYLALDPQQWLKYITTKTIFLGEGLKVYRQLIEEGLKDLAVFAPTDYNYPRASVLGRLGLDKLCRGEVADITSLAPTYLRRSEAEIKWEEKRKEGSG